MSFEALRADVIDRGLCARCGLCAGVCPTGAIGFPDDLELYPELTGKCTDCGLCNKVCPGAEVDYPALSEQVFGKPHDPLDPWGHMQKLWVGYPADKTVRDQGASGGLTTGILLYLLNSGRIKGAVVLRMDPDKPYRAQALVARTEEEIRSAAKSKYCIEPGMRALSGIRKEAGPFAVVGLPCQIHGLRRLETVEPGLAEKIPYKLGLYCHYNMEVRGTLDGLRLGGIPLDEIAKFEYRGGGWPGGLISLTSDGQARPLHAKIIIKNFMSMMLRLYGAPRCFMCVDGMCQFADLALGDFWAFDYPDHFGDLEWCSQVAVRTAIGREVIESGLKDGAFKLWEMPKERYPKRTRNFAREKQHEGYVRLRRFIRQGRDVPDYHFEIPKCRPIDWLAELLRFRLVRVFSGRRAREAVVKVLLSPFGTVLDRLNTVRKKIVLRFHGN